MFARSLKATIHILSYYCKSFATTSFLPFAEFDELI